MGFSQKIGALLTAYTLNLGILGIIVGTLEIRYLQVLVLRLIVYWVHFGARRFTETALWPRSEVSTRVAESPWLSTLSESPPKERTISRI